MDIGKLSATYRNETSYNGYTLDVLKSALQKYIRRGRFVKATYAAFELDMFALIEAEGIRSNLIHRLMIIFMEDVANPGMWPWMDDQISRLLDYRQARKGLPVFSVRFCEYRKKEVEVIAKIVYALSSSSHSRDNSFYKFVYWTYPSHLSSSHKRAVKRRFPWFSKIDEELSVDPEKSVRITGLSPSNQFMVDSFVTLLGQRSGAAVFFGHAIANFPKLDIKYYNSTKPAFLVFHLINKVVEKIYSGEELKKMKKLVEIGVKWYKELNPIKEDFLAWQYLVLVIVKNMPLTPYHEREGIAELRKLYRRNVRGDVMVFDEWVYDMHTRIGRRSGKGSVYFGLESSMVSNEDPSTNLDFKEAYTYNQLLKEDTPEEEIDSILKKSSKKEDRESKIFKFIVRAQLLTSDSKSDTYFALDGKKHLVFVKGPFPEGITEEFLKIQKEKCELGLPCLEWKVYHLKPDLFPDEPLGLRRRLDRSKTYSFLTSKVLFDHPHDEIPEKTHSSKVWPPTQVVDWEKVRGSSHITKDDMKSSLIRKEFIENVLFRYVYGIGDLAKRNFIVREGRVFSIDEDSYGKDFNLETALKELYPTFQEYLKKNKREARSFLEKFVVKNSRLAYLKSLVRD